MKKQEQYAYKFQSTLWKTMLKTILSEMHKQHVLFNYPSDVSIKEGHFVAIQDNGFKKNSNICSDFDALLNRGEVDLASHDKVSAAVEYVLLKPYKEGFCLIWIVHWFIGCYLMVRGDA